MKLKMIALAALMATGSAMAAPIDTGAAGNGNLFFSMWDANSSYTVNLNETINGFEAGVAAAGSFDFSRTADALFTTWLSTADLATAKWNIVALDNFQDRRVLMTYTTAPAAINSDLLRSAQGNELVYASQVNAVLAGANSAVCNVGTACYAKSVKHGQNLGGAFPTTYNNTGTVANNSYATGLNIGRIDGKNTGISKTTFSQYSDAGSNVKVYLDANRTIHIQAAPVPEPETYAMLLAGLGVMGAVARRRSQKAA